MELRSDRIERFARIFWQSREDAGKTQKYMESRMGVTRRTIANWEKGVSSPTFSQAYLWFQALGLNPLPYYFSFLYPEAMENLFHAKEDDSLVSAFELMKTILPDTMLKQLYFIFTGNHGVSLKTFSELQTSHLHLPMRDRVYTAHSIVYFYRLSQVQNLTNAPDKIPTAIDYLEEAVDQGMSAVINSRLGYTNMAGHHYSDIFKASRLSCGKSQEFMAMNLGINRRTVKNWEDGAVEPSLFQTTEWFRVLNLDIMKYFFDIIYPSLEGDYEYDDAIFDNMDLRIKQQFIFLLFGNHGSSPISVLQMGTAFAHLPKIYRTNIAEITYRAYLMAESDDVLVCPNIILPDITHLEKAIRKCKEDVFQNQED